MPRKRPRRCKNSPRHPGPFSRDLGLCPACSLKRCIAGGRKGGKKRKGEKKRIAGKLGGESSRHGGCQEHASGDGEETHGSGGGNDLSIIPTAGVSFCCCWHGIRKNLAFGRPRPFLEASSDGRDMRSTAVSPCCASTPPSSARCAWSTLHSEITASTVPRRSPSNATARLNRCSL